MSIESISEHSPSEKSVDSSQQDEQLRPLTAPWFSRIAWVTLLCSLLLMNLPLLAVAQWVAPHYRVTPKAPWKPGQFPENVTNLPLPANKHLLAPATPQSKVASNHFNEAGQIYARIGLKEPTTLKPLLKPNTRGAFLYQFGSGNADFKGAYFPGSCHDEGTKHPYKQSWIALNTNTTGIDQFKAAAHELFHAIQDQYPWRNDADGDLIFCDLEAWLTEGMADAAGFFLQEKKIGQQGPRPTDDHKFYGVRPYDVPLYQHESWSIPSVLSRIGISPSSVTQNIDKGNTFFGYRTSSFWRFLMDRYGPISAAGSLDEDRLLALSEAFMARKGPDPAVNKEGIKWVAEGVEGNFGVFQHVYGEFLAEFAAWPGGKYPEKNLSTNFLLENGFGGCEKKSFSYEGQNNTALLALSPQNDDLAYALYPLAGRCIQVTINGAKDKELTINIELEVNSPTEGGQLLMGFARQEHEESGVMKIDDDCYSHARNNPKKVFPCVFLGKVKQVKGTKKAKVRTWRSGPTKITDDNMTITYILSNVALNAGDTEGIKTVTGRIGFAKSTGTTGTGTLGSAPKFVTLDMIPDVSIPERQQLYGIKKNSGLAALFNPVNLGTFRVDALNDSGKKTATYHIMAAEPVAFGQTGPFQALVERVDVKSSPQGGEQHSMGQTGLLRTVANNGGSTITNMVCLSDSGPVGNIIRSDDEVLTFEIDTPICEFSPENMTACQNGCPVVDHFKGKLSLPFGYRYFSENQIEDVVTTSVLLDIDRYHHNVFGTPLQGLGGDGGNGSGGGPGGESSGDGGGGLGSETNSGVGVVPPCDCSCETYMKLREAQKNLTTSKDTMPDLTALLQVAQCRMQCGTAFSECRQAERQAQKNH